MTVIPEKASKTNEVETEIRPNHEHSWDGREQVKLACGCIMPVVAGAHTVGNNAQFTHQGRYSRKVVNGSRSCDRSYDHATTSVVIHERNRTYDRSQIRS